MISFYAILFYIFYSFPLFAYTLLVATCNKASNNNDKLKNSSISEKEHVEDEENSQDRPVPSPSDEKVGSELDAEANSENDDKSDNTVNAASSKESVTEMKTANEPLLKSTSEPHTQEIYVPIGAATSRPERKSILCKPIKVTKQQKIAHNVSFKGNEIAAS
ncbi:unnamed protein product, partial [Mesorhabditis belari]|uniref:Uncharacterized protein n=1 Tax=Mesorhabditis belari TaxID=2138241 RepID=A0AAF3FJ46_9BILA